MNNVIIYIKVHVSIVKKINFNHKFFSKSSYVGKHITACVKSKTKTNYLKFFELVIFYAEKIFAVIKNHFYFLQSLKIQ